MVERPRRRYTNQRLLNDLNPAESQTRCYAVEDKELFSMVSSRNVVLKPLAPMQ
jgi:hypothetical protein